MIELNNSEHPIQKPSESSGDKPLVCLQDVTFSYDSLMVLEKVNLDIYQGDFVSVVGPNGGGKTTLLKLILGLLKPEAGRVRVFGESPAQVRHRIGYTPQHARFDPQFPVTVMDVVLMGRLEHCRGGRYSRRDKEAARRAIYDMRLDDLPQRGFAALSGGQRQRVLIARALACEPDLLLLDEPTANVDPAVGNMLMEILQELNQRMTILMVSHDLGFVAQTVRSVICVNRQVRAHPTNEITGAHIHELYGGEVRMVRHDHRLAGEDHDHE